MPVTRQDGVEGKVLDKPAKVSFVTILAPNAFIASTASGKEYNDIENEERQKSIDYKSQNQFKIGMYGQIKLK